MTDPELVALERCVEALWTLPTTAERRRIVEYLAHRLNSELRAEILAAADEIARKYPDPHGATVDG